MGATDNVEVSEFIKKMPKVELHAHLNGSLSKETVSKLYSKANITFDEELFSFSSSRSLTECFKNFDIIHQVTINPEAIYTATADVISDFYADGVRYLELRSTPQERANTMSRNSYVESMLSAIERAKKTYPDLMVKVLLSINRAKPLSVAEETIKIAESHLRTGSSAVVGIDLSGNPSVGDVSTLLPILQYAKRTGLKISLHVAETRGTDEENEMLLGLEPDRIGHGIFLHPQMGGTESNFQKVLQSKIPLEICFTSNIMSQSISSYQKHHFPLWKKIDHPCVICTDDKGIFNTSLSEEYALAQHYFSLTDENLWTLSYNSIEFSFASPDEKQKLRHHWEKMKKDIFKN